MQTLKSLLESIYGVKLEEGKPYCCKTYVFKGEPEYDSGEEILDSLMDDFYDHGAVITRDEGSGEMTMKFYYRGDWSEVESKLLKQINIPDEEELMRDTSDWKKYD